MPEPTKIPRPFADSGDKNSIPDSSGSIGFASWQEGFPAITSEPFSQGGVAPKRADFNGVFNALSAATVWAQQGGVYAYDNTTDYEVGNVVLYNGNLYKCITANGPGSVVKAPTDTTVWSKVMTAADAAAAYLPLSGGTLTGTLYTKDIYIDNAAIRSKADTQPTLIYGGVGWAHGAQGAFYGKDHNDYPGFFTFRADNGTLAKMLTGKPDGTLTWDSKDVATIQTGTWTPVLKGGTTAGTFTASADGKYIKLGYSVYIYGRVEITACTSVPSGNIMISGLPYVAYGGTGGHNMTIPCRANGFDNNSAQKIYGLFVVGNTSNLIARVPSLSPTIGISMFSEGVWSTTNADTVAVKVTQGSYTGTAIIFAGWYLSK